MKFGTILNKFVMVSIKNGKGAPELESTLQRPHSSRSILIFPDPLYGESSPPGTLSEGQDRRG